MKKLLSLLFVLTFGLSSMIAQSEKGTKIFGSEDLYALKRISELTVSPDGKWVLYKVGVPNIDDNKIYSDLYATSINGKETIRLTNDNTSEFNPVWSPDSKQIAFLSTKDGDPQIFVMDFPKGTPTKVTKVEGGVGNIAWSPDGKYFSFTSDVKLEQSVSDKYPKYKKANLRIYEKLPVRHWDEWTDQSFSHLFIIPVKGGEAKDLMAGEKWDTPLKPSGGAEEIAWAPDGQEIAYTCKKEIGLRFVQNTNSDIYVYSLKDGSTKNATSSNPGYDKAPTYSPDGKYMAYFSMARNGFESDKNRLMLLNRQTGEIKEGPKNLDQWVEEKVWSHDSKTMYITITDSGLVNLYSMDVATGETKRLSKGEYDFGGGLDVTKAGTLVFGVQGFMHPFDIYTMPAKGGEMTNITSINKEFMAQFKPIKSESRWITSTDGKKVHCWVVYPPDFDPNKKYPMITYCQGGPQNMISQRFHYRWNYFLMASHGYIIVAPNRRGVPGFGQDWNDAISKDWGGKPMADLLAATDEMSKEKFVDPKGRAAMGASAGGYANFWLAGHHEKRFSAFVAHCGVFNLESMYGATEELWFPNWEYGGPYWEGKNKENYDNNSPHRFIKNWDSPIFISTGERDYRVPFTQSLEAFTAANVKGLPAELMVFPEETHFIAHAQEFIIWDSEVFKFLDRYCRK